MIVIMRVEYAESFLDEIGVGADGSGGLGADGVNDHFSTRANVDASLKNRSID